MRTFCLCLLLLALIAQANAQKKNLTIEDLKHWPHVANPAISPNGNFAAYTITDQPTGGQTLYIKAVKSQWQRNYINADRLAFSADDRTAFFMSGDTLHTLTLGQDKDERTPTVKRFQLLTLNGKEYTLIHTKNNTLTILSKSKSKSQIQDVISYTPSKNGKVLLLKKENELTLFNLADQKGKTIHQGRTGQMILDDAGNTIAYTTTNGKQTDYHVYRNDQTITATSLQLINPDSLIITGMDKLSSNGRFLFVKAKEKPLPPPAPDAVMVDVWSWTDKKLQSEQLNELKNPKAYTCMLDISAHTLKRIQFEDEQFPFVGPLSPDKDTLLLVTNYPQKQQSLRNIITGKETLLPFYTNWPASKDGRYLCFQDSLQIKSYDLKTNQVKVIGDVIPDTKKLDYPYEEYMNVINWADSKTIILYDKYDLWAMDATGKTPAKNLTNGYGRTHNIMLRPFDKSFFNDGLKFPLYLQAFDLATKDNGFYSLEKSNATPRKLTMSAHAYGLMNFNEFKAFSQPIKATKNNTWIVSRESTQESENYFTTTDFKTLTPISDHHPEKAYNWFTNELINFTTLDGKPSQALLYKPENFDPNKKYPTIITYYEKLTQEKNIFLKPELPLSTVNVPWELQREYLILTIDINYSIGKPGESALSAIEGFMNYLPNIQTIDDKKIGLVGHSFGGFETNYIITHSREFVCAISSSARSSLVTSYTDLTYHGESLMNYIETGQSRMVKTLWETQGSYLDNSPLLNSDRITCPLLLMANKADGIVNFSQGIMLYQSLKRLNKSVWLLQYDKQGHVVVDENACVDRLKRFDQFLDHYLRSYPAPIWMTKGVAAKNKGTNN